MKEFFPLRKKSYTHSPQFVKRKAHDRTEKRATAQSGKRGNPRLNSANFCGIQRTRQLLPEEKNRCECPSQGFKGKPEFRLNRRASTFSGGLLREAPRLAISEQGSSTRKKPETGLAKKPSSEPLKEPRAEPRKAPPAANPNKKSAASTPHYWLEVSNAESNAISERGKSNERTRAADSVAPWILSMRPSSHSTESGPL